MMQVMDDRKILLLNSDYRALRFVNWQRALKLMHRGKVDIISEWNDAHIRSVSGTITLPSTIRLKRYVKYYHRARVKFSKNIVKKRDSYTCQYCGTSGKERKKQLTIDHVIPVSKGGKSTFENCVTACFTCNNKKNNKLLSETNMKLRKLPKKPNIVMCYGIEAPLKHHPQWKSFLSFL